MRAKGPHRTRWLALLVAALLKVVLLEEVLSVAERLVVGQPEGALFKAVLSKEDHSKVVRATTKNHPIIS